MKLRCLILLLFICESSFAQKPPAADSIDRYIDSMELNVQFHLYDSSKWHTIHSPDSCINIYKWNDDSTITNFFRDNQENLFKITVYQSSCCMMKNYFYSFYFRNNDLVKMSGSENRGVINSGKSNSWYYQNEKLIWSEIQQNWETAPDWEITSSVFASEEYYYNNKLEEEKRKKIKQ